MKKNNRLLKKLSKLNFSTVFFFILSLVSSTFAWFAYNKVVDSNIDIELTTWDIGMTEGGDDVDQLIAITIDNFSPGVETYTRHIDIRNNGDMPAVIDFEILSLRILDDEYSGEDKEILLDSLAHDYPYFFNFYLSTNYLEHGDMATFDVDIGWPLDSGNNELDTEWGMAAYEFYHNEQVKQTQNPSYEIRPCIELTVKLNSTQYVSSEAIELSDNYYRIGYGLPHLNADAFIIDSDSKQSNTTVTVMYPDQSNPLTYNQAKQLTSNPQNEALYTEDVIKIISNKRFNAIIKKEGITDRPLGPVTTTERATEIKNYLIETGSIIVYDGVLEFGSILWPYATDTNIFAIRRSPNNYQKHELYLETNATNTGVLLRKAIKNKICTPGNCMKFDINNITYMTPKDSTWGAWIDATKYVTSYHNGIVCVAPDNSMAGMEGGSCNNNTAKLRLNGNNTNVVDAIEPNGLYTIRY